MLWNLQMGDTIAVWSIQLYAVVFFKCLLYVATYYWIFAFLHILKVPEPEYPLSLNEQCHWSQTLYSILQHDPQWLPSLSSWYKEQNVSSTMQPMMTIQSLWGAHVLRKLICPLIEIFSVLEVKSFYFLTLQDWTNSVFSMPEVPCVCPLNSRTLKDQRGNLREVMSERKQRLLTKPTQCQVIKALGFCTKLKKRVGHYKQSPYFATSLY